MHFNFGGFDTSALYGILDAVEKSFIALFDLDLQNPPLNRGGFFSLRDGKTGDILIAIQVGEVPQKERMKRYHLSLEKGDRLFRTWHKSRIERHISSSESRNLAQNKFGGAVIAIEGKYPYILSFDGLGEESDEALMVATALKLKWMSASMAREIATAYKNTTVRILQKVIA
ncbi:hypothetical protein C4546_00190 [Candidatus Parcubacteria bacterium]|jgi:hypothetical protein|nr:MAG: hypothetical protein C4546_00190 [Candidatus Parcubacteria bacterium]